MSSFAVTAEKLEIFEHPGADSLELARVGGYNAVVAKGQFSTGDIAIYIPEAALLSDELIDELGLTGRLAGSKANRVKAIRLRGELSQGLVCRPRAIAGVDLAEAYASRFDFSEMLGITKWVPDIPVSLSGQVQAGDVIRWIDIENDKRFLGVFQDGEMVEATEKIHGSACLVTWDKHGLTVSSKGLGSKGLVITESEENTYWRAARAYKLSEVGEAIATRFGAKRVGLFGEVYGAGVQDLKYARAGSDEVGYALFDVRIEDASNRMRWLERDELDEFSDTVSLVPVLYRGPYDRGVLGALVDGPESVSGKSAHIREGLVVRAVPERESALLGGRAIVKMVSEAYLTRRGGTEYE